MDVVRTESASLALRLRWLTVIDVVEGSVETTDV